MRRQPGAGPRRRVEHSRPTAARARGRCARAGPGRARQPRHPRPLAAAASGSRSRRYPPTPALEGVVDASGPSAGTPAGQRPPPGGPAAPGVQPLGRHPRRPDRAHRARGPALRHLHRPRRPRAGRPRVDARGEVDRRRVRRPGRRPRPAWTRPSTSTLVDGLCGADGSRGTDDPAPTRRCGSPSSPAPSRTRWRGPTPPGWPRPARWRRSPGSPRPTATVRRLDDLAARAGVGARSLQRLFTRHAGVSPTWVLRRYRLLEAAEAVRGGRGGGVGRGGGGAGLRRPGAPRPRLPRRARAGRPEATGAR